jgi:hypothetical protein
VTDGGRGGNMSAVWRKGPQPGLGGNDGAGTSRVGAPLKRPPGGLSGGAMAQPISGGVPSP